MIYYAFLMRRPMDSQPWPNIWSNKALAMASQHRVSPVVEVELSEAPKPVIGPDVALYLDAT